MYIDKGKRWLGALILAASLTLLAGCGQKQQTLQPQTDETEMTEVPTGISLTTPYMTFYYPNEWEDIAEPAVTGDGENHTITFRTVIDAQEVVLFSILLGPDEAEGYLLGHLEDETAGKIRVYSVMNELSPENWTEDAYGQICAMQERVNDLIVQLYDDPRFTPAN